MWVSLVADDADVLDSDGEPVLVSLAGVPRVGDCVQAHRSFVVQSVTWVDDGLEEFCARLHVADVGAKGGDCGQ